MESEGMKLALSGESRAPFEHPPSQKLNFIYVCRDQAGLSFATFWFKLKYFFLSKAD